MPHLVLLFGRGGGEVFCGGNVWVKMVCVRDIEGNSYWNRVVGCTIMYRGYEGRDEFVMDRLRLLLVLCLLLTMKTSAVRGETVMSNPTSLAEMRFFMNSSFIRLRVWKSEHGNAIVVPGFQDFAWMPPRGGIARLPMNIQEPEIVTTDTSIPVVNWVYQPPVWSFQSSTEWVQTTSLGSYAASMTVTQTLPPGVQFSAYGYGAGSPIQRIFVGGDVITYIMPAGGVQRLQVYHNMEPLPLPSPVGAFDSFRLFGATDYILYNPVILLNPAKDVVIGTPYDPSSGLLARWGYTESNQIPDHGEIKLIHESFGWDDRMSTTGALYDKVGQFECFYEIRDSHSLSTNYPMDTTFVSTNRRITVRTPLSPNLAVVYSAVAEDSFGVLLPEGTTYRHTDLYTPTGGESGWTNQPLEISADPETIIGTFDTVLTVGTQPNITVTNGTATLHNYHIESPTNGTPASAVLTAVGEATNELSDTALELIKIDLTPPIASATYDGGFTFTDASEDALSGLSAIRYKTQIAFTTPVSDMNPPTTGWEDLDNHTMSTQGNYDVWVRATDKAGNEHTMKVFADLFVGGEVSITKDTDVGAVLHEAICLNFESITLEAGCGSACGIGLSPEVAEESALIYKLTLTNEAGTGSADGTFEDYLPEGVVVSTMPTVTPAGSATVNYVLETLPPFAGRYKVSGTYTGLVPGGRIEIDILTELPVFDGVTPANNILVNQASTDWNINAGMLTGSNESNYATHEVVVAGVDTLFTKVGANDIAQGIAGVEFVLYRWDGAFAPTAEEQGHIIDYSVLVDNTLPGGDWIRVTYDGEEALALTDIFVSSAFPLGEVDLGTLPAGIYTLIETKTSGGYALPMGQWILTIDPSKSDTGAGDWKIDFVGKSSSIAPPAAIRDESVPNAPTYKIVNAEPFLIGLSGLEGTTGVLLTGFIIMAIAANTYLVRRHKQREKQEAQEGQSL